MKMLGRKFHMIFGICGVFRCALVLLMGNIAPYFVLIFQAVPSKGSCSIVLMAVPNANYMFTYIDIGGYGRQYDSSIVNNSSFGRTLVENRLQIPESVLFAWHNSK